MKPMKLLTLSMLLVAGCAGADPDSWETPADCDAIGDAAVRDECYTNVANAVFRESPEAGEAMLTKVSDPLMRDYILLKVTREVDASGFRYCEQIENDDFEARCRVLVRRPHLHRDLMGAGARGPDQPQPPVEGPDGAKGPPPPGGPPLPPPGGEGPKPADK